MAKVKPIPKKTLQQKIKEEEVDKIGREETKKFNEIARVNKRRKERLSRMSDEDRQKLHDYIFNGGTENPLEDIQ